MTVKTNYEKWNRDIIVCDHKKKLILDTESKECKENETIKNLNCRKAKSADNVCPEPSSDIDVCRLDEDFGYVW